MFYRLLAPASLLLAVLVVVGCSSGPSADDRFVELTGNYLDRMLALNPEWATNLGDHRFDGETSDMSAAEHIQISEACVNEALEHVLEGEDVLLLLDSITRLARAYNTTADSGGRTLSGGLDAGTMLVPRQIFGSARKIEDGGSLTIVGTALVDTGSRMDEVIFQEFKGTGNMELFLSRELFQKRIFPCVDIEKSGTRKEEKLCSPEDIARVHLLRRHMTAMKPHEAMTFLLELLARYKTNQELLGSLVAKA